jgi:sec-independent protein translocase protein TatB
MFEVGFTELLVIFVLALVVLGPEKLPRLAAQVGRWIGRARAMAKQFREQLEEEVNVADLNKWQQQTPPQSTASEPPPASTAEAPAATSETPVATGSPETPASGHDSGPPPEPEATVYEPPAYASANGASSAHAASAEPAPAVESTPAQTHTPDTASHDTAAASEERPARPGDVITQTHERGI